jgi:hypothetical protein
VNSQIVPGVEGDLRRYEKVRFAQRYIAQGWKIFVLGRDKTPVKLCGPCADADWSHDREACKCLLCHGFYAATDDIERVALMMSVVPDGLLAVRTGQASGIVVLDFEAGSDIDKSTGEPLPSGLDVLDDWESWTAGRSLPPTLRARTGSGGLHLFYHLHEGVRLKSTNRILPGFDLKAEGGYVALPTPGHLRDWVPGSKNAVGRPTTELPSSLVDWLGLGLKGAWGGPGRGGFGPGGVPGYDFHPPLPRERRSRGYAGSVLQRPDLPLAQGGL